MKGFIVKQQMLKVEKKVTSWDDVLVCLCRNYVLAYPANKSGQVKQNEAPRYYIRLDKSSVCKVNYREDLSGMWPKKENIQYGMGIEHDMDKSVAMYIKFESNSGLGSWYDVLYKAIPTMKKEVRELEKWGRPVSELTKVVKMPPRIEVTCPGDRAKEWIEKMQEYRRLLREWLPMMKTMTHFCELYHEKSMDYLDWFASVSGRGFRDDLEKAEEEQLQFWKQQFLNLDEIKKKVATATEQCFFQEDFEPTVKYLRDQLLKLEAYNFYRSQVQRKSDGKEYAAMDAKLRQLIQFLSSFPAAPAVNMCQGCAKGMMKVGPEVWEFEHMPQIADNHIEFRNAKDPQQVKPFFTVGGFEVISSDWGSVLWNKASWVWFHPNLPYTIRYNFKRKDQLFAFHAVKGEPKDGQHTVMPSWKWNGKNGLQPLLSQSQQLDPAIKQNFASVVYSGTIPLPVVLLAAMMKHIQWTTMHHFGY